MSSTRNDYISNERLSNYSKRGVSRAYHDSGAVFVVFGKRSLERIFVNRIRAGNVILALLKMLDIIFVEKSDFQAIEVMQLGDINIRTDK